ncbi:LOW QUALITY PROTEIN: ankyrin repeat domain-containing protein 11-like [Paramacrobiotus metropolitanus]|uniref:LOW QUALITY PROTEIN: ankyrin repeat domain-containing protein 11-like n=1 Tax=Paramacrobiotus metropolitanus TaxID=2943436 RepID=UPI0024456100|nr:LOW QUALITY PROTEIN: ankyrin repeat domain-containing protein 11-like [Paramacrobiotus metropolitanus]
MEDNLDKPSSDNQEAKAETESKDSMEKLSGSQGEPSTVDTSQTAPLTSATEAAENAADSKDTSLISNDDTALAVQTPGKVEETQGNPAVSVTLPEDAGQRSRSNSAKSGVSGSQPAKTISENKGLSVGTPPGSPVTPETADPSAPSFERQGTPDPDGKSGRPRTGSKPDRSRRRPVDYPGSPQTIVSERQQLALLKQQAKSAEKQQSPDPSSRERPGTPSGSSTSSKDGKESRVRRDPKGETPLHVACRKGDMPTIRKLMEEGVDVNAADYAGWTPLHEAANHGREDVIKILCKNGANIHAKGGAKAITPLMDAVINGHQNIVKFLLRVGCDPKAVDADGKTCLQLADKSDEIRTILKNFVESGDKPGGTFTGTVYAKRSRDEEARKSGSDESKSSTKSGKNLLEDLQGSSTGKEVGSSAAEPKAEHDNKDDAAEPTARPVSGSSAGSGGSDSIHGKPPLAATPSQESQYEDISDDEEPKSPAPAPIVPSLTPPATSPKPTSLPNVSAPITLTVAGQPWNPPSAVFVSQAAPAPSTTSTPPSSVSILPSVISFPSVIFAPSVPITTSAAPSIVVIPHETNATPVISLSSTKMPETTESPKAPETVALPANQTTSAITAEAPAEIPDTIATAAKTVVESMPPTKEASIMPPTDTVPPSPADAVPVSSTLSSENKPAVEASMPIAAPLPLPPSVVTPLPEPEVQVTKEAFVPTPSVSVPTVETKPMTSILLPIVSLGSAPSSTPTSVITALSPSTTAASAGIKPTTTLPEPATSTNLTTPTDTPTTAAVVPQNQPSLIIRPVGPAKPQSLSLAVRVSPLTLGIPPALPIPAISLTTPVGSAGINQTGSIPDKSSRKGQDGRKEISDKEKIGQQKSPFAVSPDRIMLSLKKPPNNKKEDVPVKMEPGSTAPLGISEGEGGKIKMEEGPVASSSKKKEDATRKPMTRQRAQAQVTSGPSQPGGHRKKSPKDEKQLRGRATKRSLSTMPPSMEQASKDAQPASEEPRQKKPRGIIAKKMKNLRDESLPPKLMIESPQEYMESSARLPLKKRFTIRNEIEEFVTQRRQVEENWRNYTNNFPMKAFPKNCSEYLIMRKNYSVEAQLPKKLEPPLGLVPELKTFFSHQEDERQNLMRQHVIERDRLIMGAEQEMMRLHQRFCRIQAGITIPYSACMIISEQEANRSFQNQDLDEKTRSATRNRITMRDLIKWLEDSDDKSDYAKKEMLTRHRLEARMLRSKQRLDWMWKLEDLGMSEPGSNRNPEERENPYVPEVVVEDFVMLPDQ